MLLLAGLSILFIKGDIEAKKVKGVLQTKEGQQYLTVWGTHYEMGYAYGYLLADKIMQNINHWAIGHGEEYYWSPTEYENEVIPYFRNHFTIPSKFEEEMQGVYDGMVASGIDLTINAIGRELIVEDLHIFNAAPDFYGFTCSSLSGWGESTADDSILQGGLIIARNLDFLPGKDCILGRNSLIVAYHPTSPNEQNWISVTFAGLIGTLSGMNENGIGALVNHGNHPDTGHIPPNSLIPISYSVRNGIENRDNNSDGIETIDDVRYAIHPSTSKNAWVIHLFSPYNSCQFNPPVAILELNNIGDSIRYPSNNEDYPPKIYSNFVLVATNHERVYYPPVYCQRYEEIAESLNANFRLTTERVEIIKSCVSFWYTLQFIIFRPNLLDVFVGYANVGRNAHDDKKVHFSWNELFAPITK